MQCAISKEAAGPVLAAVLVTTLSMAATLALIHHQDDR